MNFSELNLHDDLMTGINKTGYITCTPVQEQVLKGALEGIDLYVQSQTGTGKTAAFLITTIQQMLVNPAMKGKKALVMVPTRELAVQVEEEARMLMSGTNLKTGSFYGGVGYGFQTTMLKKGVDILIGTPGRVLDLQESGVMNLSEVNFLVIDEADRMFDMGFYPDLRRLIKVLPSTAKRQTMLFSATLNTYVKNLAWEYTSDAHEITIESANITVDEIDQVLLHISSDEKVKLLLGILQNEKPESVIVFCNTKRSCEVIAKRLRLNGIECEFIIGDLPQSKRMQVLDSFKRGSLNCLIATDVAARGIDVSELSMVINFDLPNEAENYVHRIGRTARAGKSGKAYTFCSEQDVYSLPAIERYIGHSIPSLMPDETQFVADKSAGVYIQTTNYYEDNSDRGHNKGSDSNRYGRGRQGSFDRSGGNRSNDTRSRQGNAERPNDTRSRQGNAERTNDTRSRQGNAERTNNNQQGNAERPNDTRGRQGNAERPNDTRSRQGNVERTNNNQQGNAERPNDTRGRQGNVERTDNKKFDSTKRHSPDEQNMSTLSFDERMELYRKKYGSSSTASDVQKTSEKHTYKKGSKNRVPPPQDDRTTDTKHANNSTPKNQKKHGDGRLSHGKDIERKNTRESHKHDLKTSKKGSTPVTKPATPAKKGLLSSFKKFFSNKKN